MRILGISSFFHDSAACLLIDGAIIAGAQEERFTRIKFDKRFPENAIRFCLKQGNLSLEDIDAIVFYEKPHVKFDRLLTHFMEFAPSTYQQFVTAIPEWISGKLHLRDWLEQYICNKYPKWNGKILFAEHHQSHAASAFFPSPFESAATLVMDGVGEWASSSVHLGDGSNLTPMLEQLFPHSLGMLYSAFTHYTGFRVNSGEYKMMGLAPYGEPVYTDKILDNIIDLKADGSFQLDLSYFEFHNGLNMTSRKFHDLFGGPPRQPETPIRKQHIDISTSIQKVTEEIVIRSVKHIRDLTGQENLCMAGGVALNCVANGKILREKVFNKIWIQPAAGDAGGALGAALAAHHLHYRQERKLSGKSDNMQGAYLGPLFEKDEIKESLVQAGAKFIELDEDEFLSTVASDLANGLVVGWFNGRMEYGPRALGARSILGDPRVPDMQKKMNLKIKFRESFRPFAPAVIEEQAGEYFDLEEKSPYMLLVSHLKSELRKDTSSQKTDFRGLDKVNELRSTIPAITHIDYSARVQTVSASTNPKFHDLISRFEKLTDCAVIINTSFNIRGEPIVCSPWDAFRCFMGTDMDVLAIGNYYLRKEDQDPNLKNEYRNEYELD